MLPSDIKLHKEEGSLSLHYSDGSHFRLSGEYLRVHSPSAEVRGHGAGQEILQYAKKEVKVTAVETAGNYALQLHFSDDHNTGIYSWQYLRELGENYSVNWERYLEKLQQAGKHREPDVQVVQLMDPKRSS